MTVGMGSLSVPQHGRMAVNHLRESREFGVAPYRVHDERIAGLRELDEARDLKN